jgi:hypothetical protein
MGSYRTLSYGIRGGGHATNIKGLSVQAFFCLPIEHGRIWDVPILKVDSCLSFAVKTQNGMVDNNTVKGSGKSLSHFDDFTRC